MRIRMDVLDGLHEFDFVLAAVQDGDLESPLQQAVDGMRAGRSGTADHECFHG